MRATTKQIEYIRDLADKAGYTGDRAYNAANDLLGDGRGWDDIKRASQLIDALKTKLGVADTHKADREDPETTIHTFRRADGSIGTWKEY